MSESLYGINFNPIGTPFEGEEDTDTSDTYQSKICGLVYVRGRLTVDEFLTPATEGCVIANQITVNQTGTFDYDPVHYDYPPPGFATGDPMQIVPGSWQRAAAD